MFKSTLLKLLLLFSLLNMLMCPVLFGLVLFAPDKLGFLEPVVCPADMRLERKTSTQSTNVYGQGQGNVTSISVFCTDGRQKVDVAGKMTLLAVGLPLLGGVLLVVWASVAWGRRTEEPVDSLTQGEYA
jgi:hypothetical protein